MLDADIRAALRRDLEAAHAGAEHRIIDELGLRMGGVRADVAVVNATLTGYEIKSPADGLRRLPRQAEVYSEVFDRAAIVVAEEHFLPALAIVPDWWSVVIAADGADGVHLDTVVTGWANPSPNPRAVAELLWHEQVIDVLRARGAARGLSGKSRRHAWDRLVEVCTLDEIREAVRAHLMTAQIGAAT